MRAALFVFGFMAFGSLNTLCSKLQFSLRSVGLDGHFHEFSKPWFGSYRMFFAMSLVLYGYALSCCTALLAVWWQERGKRFAGHCGGSGGALLTGRSPSSEVCIQSGGLASPLLQTPSRRGAGPPRAGVLSSSEGGKEPRRNVDHAEDTEDEESSEDAFLGGVTWSIFFRIAVPACCDLIASTLAFVGLVYVNASVWQMLRGSMIVFSGLLSVLFLKRQLWAYNWAGIALCVCGIILVGSAGALSAAATEDHEASTPSSERMGIMRFSMVSFRCQHLGSPGEIV